MDISMTAIYFPALTAAAAAAADDQNNYGAAKRGL